jgi:hypothetical protein
VKTIDVNFLYFIFLKVIIAGMEFVILIFFNKLLFSGIDLPQSGFRPSERIQETGRRLARVAEHWGVPFEFHAIAEKWEAITPAHLLLRNDEVLAVNCAFRLRHLLDESVVAASPRDLVLNRIRSMNPKVTDGFFCHSIVLFCYQDLIEIQF